MKVTYDARTDSLTVILKAPASTARSVSCTFPHIFVNNRGNMYFTTRRFFHYSFN